MADTLARICADKRDHIAHCKAAVPVSELLSRINAATLPRGFARALRRKAEQKQTGLVAEIKKASPSAGLIREDFDPATLARAYASAGAACLSVLTDTPYFQGADEYLQQARAAVSLPVLRKDFMLDPYQVIESRALGADCILLILAALDDVQAAELETAAQELGMDVLLEVHGATELERALRLKSPLLGINNRNLKTLEVDLATTEQLLPLIPADKPYTVVCESGIASRADIQRMQTAGAYCFLIGESLLRQEDVGMATRNLLQT